MDRIFEKLKYAVKHLEILHGVFKNSENFSENESLDRDIYLENSEKLARVVGELSLDKQLYDQKGRQMILADLIEYIFLVRCYYSMQTKSDRQNFVRLILYLVNLLMSYETITASGNLRQRFLNQLNAQIPEVGSEERFNELLAHTGTVGLPASESDAPRHLNKYFDSILPKTAGGLWHELLVFIFMLRNNLGYIVPLLLTQRLMSLERYIIPPDFLIITHDKRIYGVEVGLKKQIQSGAFSLQTSIPTATIDTINSRVSDRCPICHRWIHFCDFVINRYSDLDCEIPINKSEVRCLEGECTLYSCEEIAAGACPYTKYSRNPAQTREYACHEFANSYHYHYQCVLKNVTEETKRTIIEAKDSVALKTHYPFYTGLEELM